MDTFNFITRNLVIVCFLAFGMNGTAFSTSPSNVDIIKRIENLNTIIDVRVTDEVTGQIYTLIEKRKREAETILGRTSLYFPMIENLIREKNLPDELKYIAVIESSLIPDVESRQGAAGMWQFMKGTAELYGLKVNKHVDERKDLVKATDKALDYLNLLYETYGNWTLALAAYNCGDGTINKAIRKAGGTKDYWSICKYLPKETQKYIPRFIAASYLMNYYYVHDMEPREPSDDLKYIVSVKIYDKLDFKKISKEFEIDLDLIRFLNPMYRKDIIPASEDGLFHLTLPDVKMFAYIEKYSDMANVVGSPYVFVRQFSPQEILDGIRNNVTIDRIAGIRRKNFAVRDNLKDSSHLQKLRQNLLLEKSPIVLHRLRKKESLLDVAEANNMPLGELLAINNINESEGIAPGSIIRVSK